MIKSSRKRSVSTHTHTHTHGVSCRRFERRHRFNESNEVNVTYEATYASFDSEEDSAESGLIVDGDSASWDIDLDLKEDSLEELFSAIKKALYMDEKGYEWAVETSDMNGETCFMVFYEGNENNDLASKRQIDEWKRGERNLWYVRGRIPVKRVISDLDDEMIAFAQENNLEVN